MAKQKEMSPIPINIDMSGASAGGGFEVLPAGVYPAKVTECKMSAKPGQSGHHYLTFVYQAQGENKRNVWANYSLSPNALWKLKTDLTALGIEVPDGTFEFEPEDVIGLNCQIKVSVKPHYNKPDEEDNDLEEVLPPSSDQSFDWS